MPEYCVYIEHDNNYQDFADKVLPIHKKYCDKHGYDLIINNKGGQPFLWAQNLKDSLHNYKWVWMLGIDTIIMNHTIKIEDKIDDNYSMIVARDKNGPNLHSWLIKNDKNAISYLDFTIESRNNSKYTNHGWKCNKLLHDYHHKPPYKDFFKIVSGRYMNAYDKSSYAFNLNTDGCDSVFQEGDWLLHMPGLTKEQRFELVKKYESLIVY